MKAQRITKIAVLIVMLLTAILSGAQDADSPRLMSGIKPSPDGESAAISINLQDRTAIVEIGPDGAIGQEIYSAPVIYGFDWVSSNTLLAVEAIDDVMWKVVSIDLENGNANDLMTSEDIDPYGEILRPTNIMVGTDTVVITSTFLGGVSAIIRGSIENLDNTQVEFGYFLALEVVGDRVLFADNNLLCLSSSVECLYLPEGQRVSEVSYDKQGNMLVIKVRSSDKDSDWSTAISIVPVEDMDLDLDLGLMTQSEQSDIALDNAVFLERWDGVLYGVNNQPLLPKQLTKIAFEGGLIVYPLVPGK